MSNNSKSINFYSCYLREMEGLILKDETDIMANISAILIGPGGIFVIMSGIVFISDVIMCFYVRLTNKLVHDSYSESFCKHLADNTIGD
jgi:hypothetical protein